MLQKCTREQFLETVKDHELTILLDNGVYRHLHCAKPGTGICSFSIVTWPGYLAYCGDMGDFTFSRLRDMFEFFGGREGDDGINPGYWSQKVQAHDRDGVTEFSHDKFRDAVLSDARGSLGLEEDADIPDDVMEEIRHLLWHDDEFQSRVAVDEFEHETIRFPNFWERDLHVFTFRFLFCCYAIVWAIDKYEKAKAAR